MPDRGKRQSGRRPGTPAPDRTTVIDDLLKAHPGAAEILRSFGLRCESCEIRYSETLEEGCRPLGIDPEAVLRKLREPPAAGRGEGGR